MSNIIHYGIGKDYLSNWGLNEALREIYQNFIDYGDYNVITTKGVHNMITISNDYVPTDLRFLQIGYSDKDIDAIGKHGEGLKMALLVLARLNLKVHIYTNGKAYTPTFVNNGGIDECFAIKVYDTNSHTKGFAIKFECHPSNFDKFVSNVIVNNDIIYEDNVNGRIVDKPKGNIYSGGLFITNVNNLTRAYDIYPRNMVLDRDRNIPRTIDVNYHSSKLNAGYNKWTFKDLTYSDAEHIGDLPDRLKEQVSVKRVGNNIGFTYKDDDDKDVVITNTSIIDSINRDSFFVKLIKAIKRKLNKDKDLYSLLVAFKAKHVYNSEAFIDFDEILDVVKPDRVKENVTPF